MGRGAEERIGEAKGGRKWRDLSVRRRNVEKKGEQVVTDEAISENNIVKLVTKIIMYRRRQYGST